jgi:type 1 glutamine amidotransferase
MKKLAILLLAYGLMHHNWFAAETPPSKTKFRVLVLTETGGQHGAFVEAAKAWLEACGDTNGFAVDYFPNTDQINSAMLVRYRLFLQLNYPPYGWKPEAVAAFITYIEKGQGGWLGFHHASLLGEFDGYPMWDWFSEFMGHIRFKNYIAQFASGTVRVEDPVHPCMQGLSGTFVIPKEEWYTYNLSPRPNVHVLASVDESSYSTNTPIKMGDHPVVWTNEKVAARNVYIFMGHGPDLFANSAFTSLCRNAILWAAGAEDRFTLAVIPDSQQEVLQPGDGRLGQRLEWLAANQAALNLKMVLHVGDLLNWDTPDHAQYERASTALAVLDRAGIPYAVALGNHDTAATTVGGSAAPGKVNTNLRNTATFNHYFPTTRFQALGGTQETGKVDNAYHTFSAGGLDWLVLNLELWPRDGAVNWAAEVLRSHPHHNVIVLTHSHLNARSAIEQTQGGYGDNSPQYVFDHLLKEHANVRLVFSGHVGSHGYRKDAGTHGNDIHQFLQCYHDNSANPVRLFEIDTRQGTIQTRVFCPSTGHDKNDGSALTITNIDWVIPASPSRAGVPGGAPGLPQAHGKSR